MCKESQHRLLLGHHSITGVVPNEGEPHKYDEIGDNTHCVLYEGEPCYNSALIMSQ